MSSPQLGLSKGALRWIVTGICIFLAAITWLVFGQTLGHDFVDYDDPSYVYENTEVMKGLTVHGIIWAFTHAHSGNWHPLTSISHMLDCQFYGLNAGGHDFTFPGASADDGSAMAKHVCRSTLCDPSLARGISRLGVGT